MKPLTFSRPMILARRAGRKTQTRRLINPQPPAHAIKGTHDKAGDAGVRLHFAGVGYPPEKRLVCREDRRDIPGWKPLRCPYTAGEHLWVREDFQVLPKEDHPHVIESADGVFVRYLADGQVTLVELDPHERGRWLARKFPYRKTPARFMYRSLARDVPTLVSIRVERLQDITEEDAIAEGCYCLDNGLFAGPPHKIKGTPLCCTNPKIAFQMLWGSIHGLESWTANPWVWVLELTPFTATP